jgi:hypothetical protein
VCEEDPVPGSTHIELRLPLHGRLVLLHLLVIWISPPDLDLAGEEHVVGGGREVWQRGEALAAG